ncbi:MAG: ribokinase [Aigarchaeota archaeon]|nr:ribokinase [Aigarchaeota archaeon]MCX8193281.1 ribokinase [Nitrososphaeria archaeon]MDW7987037.1 ribokinase [Nitrososphaerota archaeon]
MSITVVGSIHVDFYIKVERFPSIGETLFGRGFQISPGGKGANQAVGCSKLGEKTYMVGRIGKDFSEYLLENFKKSGVDTTYVKIDYEHNTGVAFIILNITTGENMIVIDPGSDYWITEEDVNNALNAIIDSKIVLLQLEIPMKINIHACRLAASRGKKVILNPAPASPLPEEIFKYIDIITPNRVETSQLTGVEVKDKLTAVKAGKKLIEKGVKYVVITLGSEGALLVSSEKILYYPSFKVDVVDTTGAGDAFNAGLAVALSQGYPIEEALIWANASAAVKITKVGAQTGLPLRDDVEEIIKKNPNYRAEILYY